jgi:cell division protein ZipA
VESAQSLDPIQSQAGGHQERGRAEPVRPAQKFYIDPTLEEEPETVQPPAKNEREVADFSLDAPEESVSSSDVHEENEQPRRFARNKRSKTPVRRREEPNFGDDQMRIDFDTSEAASADFGDESFSANESGNDGAGSTPKTAKSSIEPEVLVLNVRTPEGEPISGAALLPMLLTLGFKFGDQDIFHRHVNSNGKGPVLFSLANMFKPGVFDIDNLENFETQGISLFMILPIEGDPHQVFNMMHNAARKLADEFGAQVLDGRRSVLTKQGLQQYVEKIREFERKRMIARS